MGAFVADERASASPVRLAVRIGCCVNGLKRQPRANALLALQVQHKGRSAVSVSDLLRNPNEGEGYSGLAISFRRHPYLAPENTAEVAAIGKANI
jgi:hypothetical protein